jgi:hypothetical protein
MVFWTIVGIIIMVIIGFLQISLIINPEKTKKILKDLIDKSKGIYNYLLDFKQKVNFASIIFGLFLVLIILISGVRIQDVDVGNLKTKVIGASSICDELGCYYEIKSGNSIFIPLELAHDSLISLKIKYMSNENQKIKIGIGSGIIGYTESSKDIKVTYGSIFKEEPLITDKMDYNLCNNCFDSTFNKAIGSIIGGDFFIKITPEKDIKINQMYIINKLSSKNIYRILVVLIGIFYVVIGFLGFKRKD